MPIRIFHEKPSKIHNFMTAKGYSGTVYDASFGYFQSLSGLADGTLYDHINKVLVDLGYSGTIEDMLGAFFQSQTGVSDRREAERSFWDDTSNDFSGGGTNFIIDESGNTIIDESGNTITHT